MALVITEVALTATEIALTGGTATLVRISEEAAAEVAAAKAEAAAAKAEVKFDVKTGTEPGDGDTPEPPVVKTPTATPHPVKVSRSR